MQVSGKVTLTTTKGADMMRNLADRWISANPMARISVYVVAGIALGLTLRVWF